MNRRSRIISQQNQSEPIKRWRYVWTNCSLQVKGI